MEQSKIIRRRELEALIGLKTSAIYAKLKPNPKRPQEFDPTFPRPVKLGVRAVGWRLAEVEAWIDSRGA